VSQEVNKGTLVIKAVLRKDFLQLWPIVALTAALLLLRNIVFALLTIPMPTLRVSLEIATALACGTLLVAVIQQDALTGVRHDWLTRPVPRGSLFAAKLLFVVVAITVPADIGIIVGSVLSDHSWSEALVDGGRFSLNWIGPLLILAALGTLTNTLMKAAATILAVMVFVALVIPITMTYGPDNDVIFGSGVGWITEGIATTSATSSTSRSPTLRRSARRRATRTATGRRRPSSRGSRSRRTRTSSASSTI